MTTVEDASVPTLPILGVQASIDAFSFPPVARLMTAADDAVSSSPVSPGARLPTLAKQSPPNALPTTTTAESASAMSASLGVLRRENASGFPNAALPAIFAELV